MTDACFDKLLDASVMAVEWAMAYLPARASILVMAVAKNHPWFCFMTAPDDQFVVRFTRTEIIKMFKYQFDVILTIARD